MAIKRETARKLLQKKKQRAESGQLNARHRRSKKKQKSENREIKPTPEKLEKRNIVVVEEAEQADSS